MVTRVAMVTVTTYHCTPLSGGKEVLPITSQELVLMFGKEGGLDVRRVEIIPHVGVEWGLRGSCYILWSQKHTQKQY